MTKVQTVRYRFNTNEELRELYKDPGDQFPRDCNGRTHPITTKDHLQDKRQLKLKKILILISNVPLTLDSKFIH